MNRVRLFLAGVALAATWAAMALSYRRSIADEDCGCTDDDGDG